MSDQYKGYPEYYFHTLKSIWGKDFFEWKMDAAKDLVPGQICQSYICYTKSKTFQLQTTAPNPFDTDKTSWTIKRLEGKQPLRQERLQEYDLERNEYPIVKISKLRFVILLKKNIDDWLNPSNRAKRLEKWLVLPLFTYKKRHNSLFVIDDQRLNVANRFYIPPSIQTGHRLSSECAIHFPIIQEVHENNLFAITATCKEAGMQKAIKINDFVLKLIVYHYFKNLSILDNVFDAGTDISDEYQLFKMAVNELIDENIK